jgi:hypothetical protein
MVAIHRRESLLLPESGRHHQFQNLRGLVSLFETQANVRKQKLVTTHMTERFVRSRNGMVVEGPGHLARRAKAKLDLFLLALASSHANHGRRKECVSMELTAALFSTQKLRKAWWPLKLNVFLHLSAPLSH